MNLIVGLGQVFWEYYFPNINKKTYDFLDIIPTKLPSSLTCMNNIAEVSKDNYKCIYVLTPPDTHSEIINKLYTKTESFYIEKPTFKSLEEFEKAKLVVKNVSLLGGHSRRFFNNYIEFKKILLNWMNQSRIVKINISEGALYKWSPKSIESILDDELSHLIDSVLYILNYTEKTINQNIIKVSGDNITNLHIEFAIDDIPVVIDYSRNSDLIDQIEIVFENNTSLHLNTKLNGAIHSYKNNILLEVKTKYKKQSSVSVFNEIITHINSNSFIHDDSYKLTKFYNTLSIIDKIKEEPLK